MESFLFRHTQPWRTPPNPRWHRAQSHCSRRTGRHDENHTKVSTHCPHACRAAEGLCVQNDLLSMYVGAASQHLLRMSFVPEQEAKNFDTQVAAFRSQLIQCDATYPLFFFASQAWVLRIGSAVQRHAAAPWRARQSVNPTLMATTHPYKHCTTTPSPTCSTSNHTLTTDEQASLPPQTTWLSPSPKSHTKEAGHHNPTTIPQAAS